MSDDARPVRLGIGDGEWVTELLTGIFASEPPATSMFAVAKTRERTRYFMACGARYALMFGEAYSSPGREAVALWLTPGATAMSPVRMFRAGMFKAPFNLGKDFSRFMSFVGHTDKEHRAAAPMPHYYLLTLGVGPSARGKGLGTMLLRDMLARSDRENRPCFLETQNEANVAYYERLGFRTASKTPIAKLVGLYNMAMVRMPGAA